MKNLDQLREEKQQLIEQLRDNELQIRHELRELMETVRQNLLITSIMELPTKLIEKIVDNLKNHIAKNVN
jgi:hypothetical protein